MYECLFLRWYITSSAGCEVLVELESKAKVWMEEEKKEKAEEVALSKTRWVWLAHCILPVNACQESTFR